MNMPFGSKENQTETKGVEVKRRLFVSESANLMDMIYQINSSSKCSTPDWNLFSRMILSLNFCRNASESSKIITVIVLSISHLGSCLPWLSWCHSLYIVEKRYLFDDLHVHVHTKSLWKVLTFPFIWFCFQSQMLSFCTVNYFNKTVDFTSVHSGFQSMQLTLDSRYKLFTF